MSPRDTLLARETRLRQRIDQLLDRAVFAETQRDVAEAARDRALAEQAQLYPTLRASRDRWKARAEQAEAQLAALTQINDRPSQQIRSGNHAARGRR